MGLNPVGIRTPGFRLYHGVVSKTTLLWQELNLRPVDVHRLLYHLSYKVVFR